MPNHPVTGSQWERLSNEAERFLAAVYTKAAIGPQAVARESLAVQPRVSLFPGAGGSTAFFDPTRLRIEVNPDLQTDLDPTFTSLLKQSTRLQVPVLAGALIHEVAHSLYSRHLHTAEWFTSLTPWDRQLVTLWEESRIENLILQLVAGDPAAHARTRTLLRASAAKVTNWDAPSDTDEAWTRGKAASAVSLVLARAVVGILSDDEVAPLVANLRAGGLPQENIERLSNVIRTYHAAGSLYYVNPDTIFRLIEEWRDAISVLPIKQDDEGEDTGGCGGGATGQGQSTEPPVPTNEPGQPGQPVPDFHPEVEEEEPEPDEDEEPDTEGGLPGAESDEEEPEEEPEGEDTNSEPEDADEAPEGQDDDEPEEDGDGEDADLDDDEGDLDEDADEEDEDADEDDLDEDDDLDDEDDEDGEEDSDSGHGGGNTGQPGVLEDISRKAQEDEAPRQAAEAAAEERIEARRAVAMKASRHRDMITKFKRTPEGASVLDNEE